MNATVLFADISGAAISTARRASMHWCILAAALAAARMHQCIEALRAVAGAEPSLRVAFHSGPVIQVDKDVLGDTVKLAASLVAQAQRGQTLTSGQTAAQ